MLMKPNEPAFMTADEAATRRGRAGQSELALRNALEAFARQRWPDARLCHEMVMGERRVRADMVAVAPDWMAAFEVKGAYDDTTRLLHQVGMYQLCMPEVWMVVPVGRHADDARVLRHLLPSLGLLVGAGTSARNHYEFDEDDPVSGLRVEAEPVPRDPHVEMMLEMMWAAELRAMCDHLCVARGKRSPRLDMIRALASKCTLEELRAACCRELRHREALWRADAPAKTPWREAT